MDKKSASARAHHTEVFQSTHEPTMTEQAPCYKQSSGILTVKINTILVNFV